MKKREDPLEEMRKQQARATAQRQELLDRMKARPAKAEPVKPAPLVGPPAFDMSAAQLGASSLHLMALEAGVGAPTPLNRPTLELLGHYFRALDTQVSASVLQWPVGPRDVSLLHPLAMMALMHPSDKRSTNGYVWCEPARYCRTLYFPWRGGANLASQRFLLRRAELIEWNSIHLGRPYALPDRATGVADKLHATLGHLNVLKLRDTTKPHLAHPSLPEIYPIFTAAGGERPPPHFVSAANELFGRVRHGAALQKMTDHRVELSAPETSPYAFFGVFHDADVRKALSARAISGPEQAPNICILDLSPLALKRLGHDWADKVEEFVTEARKRFADMPFLAVAQSPFEHRKAESILRAKARPKAPVSHVVVRTSRDCVKSDPLGDVFSQTDASFSVAAGPTSDAVAALSEAAAGCSDPGLASTLRRHIGALRRAASLPCGLSAAYDILCDEKGQANAEAFLEAKSASTLLAPIGEALASEISGAERARFVAAKDAVEKAFASYEQQTPIGSVAAAQVAAAARKSSRSVIAFATAEDRLLAERAYADASEAGQRLRSKLEKGAIRFTTMDEMPGVLTGLEKLKDRNSWKRLLLIAPHAEHLGVAMTRSWLPDELIVICERTLATRIADTYQRLSQHPDLAGAGKLGERLTAVAAAAKNEADARNVASIDLELTAGDQLAIPDEELIDLTDDDDENDGERIEFALASGRRLRARPGQTLIRYNPDAEINFFERMAAREVRPPFTIVTPDSAFIAEAREILPLRVLAESWVNVYHTMVEAQLPNVNGANPTAKARSILARMQALGAGASAHGTVVTWLKVDEYKQLPPEKRRPHAPQSWREFKAFTAALGIDPSVAEKMWLEGVKQLRIDRQRAGQRMAQAFVSVLVDPYGTTSGYARDIRDRIGDLRKKALDHLDQVIGKKELEGD